MFTADANRIIPRSNLLRRVIFLLPPQQSGNAPSRTLTTSQPWQGAFPAKGLLINAFCYLERLWMRYLQHFTTAEDSSESSVLLRP